MIRDYRNTMYCSELRNVSTKKNDLEVIIKKNNPKTKIIYNKVQEGGSQYKRAFMMIYNFKCAYCGNSIENTNITMFEVDHYICESSFKSKEIAGKMTNLILACYDCNRSKSSFFITEEYREILNPDSQHITNVFNRDDSYYIKISDEYRDDEFVYSFYEKLKFSYQSRRLDYLLLNIQGLCRKMEGMNNNQLSNILRKLQHKRNLASLKLTAGEGSHTEAQLT
ncbi:HNH endonuclease [Paenibacillus polysaccharolyticus]|uniref:HNH endonuclease n=1 Tax=Paenibacillus polysaccharolyticus TaxID=582692 RepID=A0A1G5KCF0_9BACL|nr:HNH endonuclease signature motif containing protein [Paenibacillus polysaccharolyticus]SCY97911.1 HNH endonuclease [Paenibacillus polysaccharolyticus]